ncbi:MAG: Maf family protein, partial [Thermoleophilaceae bacterium]|nr:Maf family protein [Thermoleophilaceae bacterium]
VIGADTEVVSGGTVLGKPVDAQQATEFLTGLAGRAHEVHGGVAVLPGNPELGDELVAHVVTTVRFRALSEAEIAAYVATGEWRERAGGYAIQGKGAMLVEAVEGDYLNVVGLSAATLAHSALLRASF